MHLSDVTIRRFCFVDGHQPIGKHCVKHDGGNWWWSVVCINLMLQASVSISWFRKEGFYLQESPDYEEDVVRHVTWEDDQHQILQLIWKTKYNLIELIVSIIISPPAQGGQLHTQSHKSADCFITPSQKEEPPPTYKNLIIQQFYSTVSICGCVAFVTETCQNKALIKNRSSFKSTPPLAMPSAGG